MKFPTTLAAILAVWSPLAAGNDFPTQTRVEYVLGCMASHGGQSYDTLYPCVCKIDKIAERISYKEYSSAEMLTYLWSTPGERGGVFRDAATNSRKRIKHLAEIVEEAENSCFVR
jgi:hypothetical protein